MSSQQITVRVPATSANLGPAFDCLGLALDLWGSVTITTSEEPRPLPKDPLQRIIVEAFLFVFSRSGLERPAGLLAQYDGSVPVARGLGASAILRGSGLLAANALLKDPFDREQLLAMGAQLEGHADNIAPALFGGLQVVALSSNGDCITHLVVPLPPELKVVLFIPEFPMPTQKSRRLLPSSLSRADAVHNVSRAALLVAALSAGRLDLLDLATQDKLHQPARSRIFPAMLALFTAAKEAGAHCAYLSGGGSTICALATKNEQSIADSLGETGRRWGVTGKALVTRPTEKGAFLEAS